MSIKMQIKIELTERKENDSMKTYKLFRIKNNKLYPLYVEAKREIPIGIWQRAECGEKVDDTHVKASGCGGKLSLRPGFHSCEVPWTDWIGQLMEDGTLAQRSNTVWCECEVKGDQIECTDRYGFLRTPFYRNRNLRRRQSKGRA